MWHREITDIFGALLRTYFNLENLLPITIIGIQSPFIT